MNWNDYPNFSASEFRCKHTGKCDMDETFMEKLQNLRDVYGKPIYITSGYRHHTHPLEAKKPNPKQGAHTTGKAVDIAIRGHEVHELVGIAIAHGFTGIGLRQHGDSRFLHLDTLDHTESQPRPWIWTYA